MAIYSNDRDPNEIMWENQTKTPMAQQTAVEWLVDQIKSDQNQKALSASEWIEVIEQAKQMEKEQIVVAYQQGTLDGHELKYGDGNQYYNETYHNDDKLENDDKDNGGAYVEEIYDKPSLLKRLDKLEMSLNGVSDMVDKLYDAIVVEENNSKTDNTWGKTINVNYVNK